MAEVENLLSDLSDLRQEIEEAFENVSGDSKALLAELQKSPLLVENQFVNNPEYSEEAGTHVMDIYLEVHEHHRQLGILCEKRKTRLKEYLHLCMFDQDSSQVRYLEPLPVGLSMGQTRGAYLCRKNLFGVTVA